MERIDVRNQRYVAIIADIMHSRELEKRAEIQVKLQMTLDAINKRYAKDIASKFTITLGDEFQGVLQAGLPTMKIIETIQSEMSPIQFRFGIGVGRITTEINAEISLGADGPAYHLARDGINEVKNLESKKTEPKTNILIGIEGDPDTEKTLNTIFTLLWAVKSTWTERQHQIVALYQELQGTQREVADQLGIGQSSVQKSLSNAHFFTYRDTLAFLAGEINKTLEEGDD